MTNDNGRIDMSDSRKPKPGGLWARLFHLTAEPEEAAPAEHLDKKVSEQSESPPAEDEGAVELAPPTEREDLAAPDTMIRAKPAAPPDETESVALLETVAPLAPPESAPPSAPPANLQPVEVVPSPLPVATPAAPPAPAAPTACPSCGAARKPAAKFCDDCGWMFAADAGLALPSTPAPSIINSRANAMSASPAVRLQGRYELGAQVNERLGVNRYRGFDHEGGTPKAVIIVASALAPVAEVLSDEQPMADTVEDDIMPAFDDEPPMVAVAEGVPAGAAVWPSPMWEKELLGKAVCPSLPAVLDSFVEEDTEYLILEAPQGRVLWDAWDDPEANSDVRYGWMQQVAEGLQALHAAGAVLEGVRPELITVTASGQAVIADLSDLLPLPLPQSPPIRATLYTAPELILAPDTVDERSDLYSLGATLYALEYLHHPLEEKDFERQFVPTQITERFPDVHPLFLRLINKTFCRDINTRFPTDEASKKDPTGFSELIDTLKVCRRSFDNVRFDVAAWTTTGMVRTGNEDALAFLHGVESRQDDLHEYALVILCDGMGGYEAGEVAAALAISEIRKYLLQQPMFAALTGKEAPSGAVDVDAIKKVLEAALKHANKEVHAAGRIPGRGKRGMGCTAEVLYVDNRNVIVGHVGDSRTYHLKNGRLQQLTRDQTLVNRLVELGQLTAEEAENHPRKNELQQAIGGQPDVVPGSYSGKLKRGDWILVCSDGLTNHISNQELEKMLTREAAYSAEEAARRLLNLVNLRGATDNATIVVVRAS
jgi:PPM family protein phosphatase